MMKPSPKAREFTINIKPKKASVKPSSDEKKMVSTRRRIEEIEALREWEKEWQ